MILNYTSIYSNILNFNNDSGTLCNFYQLISFVKTIDFIGHLIC